MPTLAIVIGTTAVSLVSLAAGWVLMHRAVARDPRRRALKTGDGPLVERRQAAR